MSTAERNRAHFDPGAKPAALQLNDILCGLLLAEADRLGIGLSLRTIQCSASVTTFVVELGGGSFTVTSCRWS